MDELKEKLLKERELLSVHLRGYRQGVVSDEELSQMIILSAVGVAIAVYKEIHSDNPETKQIRS